MYLSPKQLKLVHHAHNDKLLCLAGGATRSGKSLGACWGFVQHVIHHQDREHALAGWSLESLMRNVGYDIIQLFQEHGYGARLNRTVGTRILMASDHSRDTSIWVVGANDARGMRRIQGATLSGAFVDEAVGLPANLWWMLWTRLTFPDSKIWATYNPDVPTHWFKREIEDRHKELNGVHYPFLFEDNPGLAPEVRERLKKTLKGHWYKRLAEGLWYGAVGLVYPEWRAGRYQMAAPKTIFALDWGVASVTAALRAEVKDGKANIIDEYYYDAREEIPLTDTEHAHRFSKWAGKVGARVIVDPSTSPSFKRLLRKFGYQVVNAKNRVQLDCGTQGNIWRIEKL